MNNKANGGWLTTLPWPVEDYDDHVCPTPVYTDEHQPPVFQGSVWQCKQCLSVFVLAQGQLYPMSRHEFSRHTMPTGWES